jgi:outer membrane protein TolC
MKLVSIHKLKVIAAVLLWGISLNGHAQNVWTLDQCIDSATVNNTKLKIDKNNILLTAEKEKEVKSNLVPKVTANGDYKYYTDLPTQLMPLSVFGGPDEQFKQAQFGVPHNINLNLQLTMPLYSPILFGGIEKIKIASEVSELQYQKTEEQVIFDISYYYYNAQIIKSQLEFIDVNLVNSKQLLKNVALLHEQLLLTKTDVDKVSLQVQQLTTNKMIVQNKYNQVINGLKLMLGVDLDKSIDVESTISKGTSIEYTTQQTIDMKLVNAQYDMLNSELGTLQKTRFLPSVYLYGSFGTLGYGYSGETNQFLDFYTMGFGGLKVSYPIFNGTVTQKQINQKNIELDNNGLQQELIKDQNTILIDNSKLQLKVTEHTLSSTDLQIQLAQSIYNQVLIQQKEGLASLTEVLLADSALREVQQSYLSTIIDYLKADLELKKLTGNLTK